MVGLVLAIAGAATGGGLTTDDYHQSSGGSAHKALGGLTVAAAAIQVTSIAYKASLSSSVRQFHCTILGRTNSMQLGLKA